jgi:hypothetical protein
VFYDGEGDRPYHVTCWTTTCCADTRGYATEEEAVTAWNTRHIAALRQPAASGESVLVPREPTVEMVEAGRAQLSQGDVKMQTHARVMWVWEAMVNAAPAVQPAASVEEVARAAVEMDSLIMMTAATKATEEADVDFFIATYDIMDPRPAIRSFRKQMLQVGHGHGWQAALQSTEKPK